MTLKAAPGIYLIKPHKDTKLDFGESKRTLRKGEIIDVGADRKHDQGGDLVATYKKGDVIWFLSYDEGADSFKEEKQTYNTVIFNDARCKVE